MLILVFCIALVVAVVGTVLSFLGIYDTEEFFKSMAIIGYIVAGMCLFIILIIWPDVATAGRIDEKIAMYEEENAKIEAQMDILVDKYMKYEKETFSYLKSDQSPITLVTLFPELKSDELVKEQIEVYTFNNTQIKHLKEEKINMQMQRWMLFFKK